MTFTQWRMFRRTRRALKALVQSTLTQQGLRPVRNSSEHDGGMRLREYCMVTFKGARQTGQTHAVLGLMPMFKRMVLVYSRGAKAKQAWDELHDKRIRITSLAYLQKLIAKKQKFDCIVFDDASIASSAMRNKVIQLARKVSTLKCLIFLG